MKLLRYGDVGREKPGLLDTEGAIRDLSSVVDDITGQTLAVESLSRLRGLDHLSLPLVDGDPRLGPCVSGVGKVICTGLNYKGHPAEIGMQDPDEPFLFMKATSAICGPNDPVIKPPGSTKLDWEVELAIVIGRDGVNIPLDRVPEHIAGYCLVNDISERAFQFDCGGEWVKGKSADTFCPMGPWLVTADEIDDPQSLDVWLDIDGKRIQQDNTASMIFGIAELVSYISRFMSLQAGDVIPTGTPAGTGLGQKPETYLEVGQTMHLGVAGLGEQRQEVVAPSEAR